MASDRPVTSHGYNWFPSGLRHSSRGYQKHCHALNWLKYNMCEMGSLHSANRVPGFSSRGFSQHSPALPSTLQIRKRKQLDILTYCGPNPRPISAELKVQSEFASFCTERPSEPLSPDHSPTQCRRTTSNVFCHVSKPKVMRLL